MDGTVKKCLMRWHEYSDSVTDALQSLRHQEELLDVTLACEGKTVRAHKLVLAAGSQYFRKVFKEYPCEHPTIILDGISWKDLLNILQFMYCGLVFVDEKSACSLLNAAYTLDVIGLNYVTEALLENKINPNSEDCKDRPKVITKIKYKSVLSNYEDNFSSDAFKLSACSSSNSSISNIYSNNNDTSCLNQISQKDSSTTSNTPVTNPSSVNSDSYEPNICSLDNSSDSSNNSSSNTNCNNFNIKKCNNDNNSSNNNYNNNGQSTAKIVNRFDDGDTNDSLLQPLHKKTKIGSDHTFQELQRNRGFDEAPGDVYNGFLYNHVDENKMPTRTRIHPNETPSQQSSREENNESRVDDVLYRIGKMSSLVNGESATSSLHPISKAYEGLNTMSKSYEDYHSLDNETIHDEGSFDNGDTDMGPAPLPLNHPAILASSKTTLEAVSAAAAALAAAAANKDTINSMNYAALLAANSRSMNNSSGAENLSSLHNTPSPNGMTFSSWMAQSSYNNNNNTSPSPSPPSFGGGLPPGFIHPPGMSQQDLQATLEQYQRKLAFHEPRPCPTCRRMYRDAATLRTHIAIMHSEGKEPFACSCGAFFRTKYDMYQHKKNGHR